MRIALACVAMLVAARAYADDPQLPPGTSPIPLPAGPAPGPAPAPTPAPQTGAPQPEQPAPADPAADPAYGEKPDPAYTDRPGADSPSYVPAPTSRDIYIKSYPDRSRHNVTMLAVGAGASLVLGGLGLYFHLDSRAESTSINAHRPSGEPWTSDRQDAYDSAHSSAIAAGVLYGLGGAFLLTTAIVYIATEPKLETIVIHPHADTKPVAIVAPTRGGALVGGTWSF
jgi:hypothetical protein